MVDSKYLHGVILTLSQSIQAARIYPPDHRRVLSHMHRLFGRVQRLATVLGTLHIGVIGNHFVVDEVPFLETERTFPARLWKQLRDLGIEKISIGPDITYGELKRFVFYLSSGKEDAYNTKWEQICFGTIQRQEGAMELPGGLAYVLPRNHVLRGVTHVLKGLLRSLLGDGRDDSAATGREIVSNVLKGLRQDDFMIHHLVRLRSHDDYTVTHSLNVAAMVMAQAIRLGIPESQVKEFGLAALLHDVGKELIPSEILRKPGKISEWEFARIALHPVHGANLLRKIHAGSELPIIVCYEHHIKFNRSGYPSPSYAGPLHLASYLTQVADVYDALRTTRPYRKSLSLEESLSIMKGGRGTEFEPAIFDNFVETILAYASEQGAPPIVESPQDMETPSEVTSPQIDSGEAATT